MMTILAGLVAVWLAFEVFERRYKDRLYRRLLDPKPLFKAELDPYFNREHLRPEELSKPRD